MSPVWSPTACKGPEIKWVSAPYVQRGLFGLDGGEEVALELIREGTLINAIADGLAPALKLKPADARRRVWLEIAQTPEKSAVLQAAVFSRLQAAAQSPDAYSEAARRLLASTVRAMQDFKIFLAQEALDAYDSWHAGTISHKNIDHPVSALQLVMDYGSTPPDFDNIVGAAVIGNLASGTALSFGGTVALLDQGVFKTVFPYALRPLFKADPALSNALRGGAQLTRNASKAFAEASQRLAAEQAAKAAAKAGAEVAEKAAATATRITLEVLADFMGLGPQIIVVIATEMIELSIEQVIAINEARPKLVAALATAQNAPPDVKRLMGNPKGQEELQYRWELVMAGATPPLNTARFALSAAEIEARANPQWGSPPAAAPAAAQAPAIPLKPAVLDDATDIALSADGFIWYIGKDGPAGSSDKYIYSRLPFGPKRLYNGAAVRISVDRMNNPWVVNSAGQLFHWTGGDWQLVRNNVRDVGLNPVSNKFWILGSDGIAYGLTGANTWAAAPNPNGKPGVAIATDPAGNPWVINQQFEIWRLANGTWQQVPGIASAISIGMDGTVYVVGPRKQVFRLLPGEGNWRVVPDTTATRLGAGGPSQLYFTR
jgi:hypothetical protein